MLQVETNEEFKACIESDDMLELITKAGFDRPIVSLSVADKAALVHAVSLHCSILEVKAEVDQLREGLKLMNVLQYIEEQGELLESFLCDKSTPLNPGKHSSNGRPMASSLMFIAQ